MSEWYLVYGHRAHTHTHTGSLNCAAFMAGIIEAFLNGTQFVSGVPVMYCFYEAPG